MVKSRILGRLMMEELLEIVLSLSVFLLGLVMMLLSWRLYRVFRGGEMERVQFLLFVATLAFAVHSIVYFLFDIVFPQPWVGFANMVTHLVAAVPFVVAIYLLRSSAFHTFLHLSVLHDLIKAFHDKVSEALSPMVAETLRTSTADRFMKKWDPLKNVDPAQSIEVVAKALAECGASLQIQDHGAQLLCEIKCPFARSVHSLLSGEPECPLSILVLGAVRVNKKGARLSSTSLDDYGSRFTITS